MDGIYVYVANRSSDPNASGSISVFRVDFTTGGLTALPGSPFSMKGHQQPTAIVVRELGLSTPLVYTANGSTISEFSSDGTGALFEELDSPFAVPGRFGSSAGVQDFIVSANSPTRYLYTANAENSISAFSIDDNHRDLDQLSGAPYVAPGTDAGSPQNLASIAITGSNSDHAFIYGMNAASNDISVWSMDGSTGILTYLRVEQHGRVLTGPENRMRVTEDVPHPGCLITSNGYTMVLNGSTGTTSLVPGSPFLKPGDYPDLGTGSLQ